MLEILKEKKNYLIVGAIIVLIIIYCIYNNFSTNDELIEEQNILVSSEDSEENVNDEDEEIIVIHVTGAVNTPGIVRLEEGSRIEDAIEAAGGLTEDSDISDINLAYVLEDGVKIRIPTIDDKENGESYIIEGSGDNIILEENTEASSDTLVNINKADETELDTLPGIGPSLASKIIQYREENGNFKKIEDIKNVTGIGDTKYANLKDFIKVK